MIVFDMNIKLFKKDRQKNFVFFTDFFVQKLHLFLSNKNAKFNFLNFFVYSYRNYGYTGRLQDSIFLIP